MGADPLVLRMLESVATTCDSEISRHSLYDRFIDQLVLRSAPIDGGSSDRLLPPQRAICDHLGTNVRSVLSQLARAAHESSGETITAEKLLAVAPSLKIAASIWILARGRLFPPLEPRSDGIAFFHLTIQEHLAAEALPPIDPYFAKHDILSSRWWRPVLRAALGGMDYARSGASRSTVLIVAPMAITLAQP